jgi:hypothetical protein
MNAFVLERLVVRSEGEAGSWGCELLGFCEGEAGLFASDFDSDSRKMRLTGVTFDTIVGLAHPWCPEPHILPTDRLDNKTLQGVSPLQWYLSPNTRTERQEIDTTLNVKPTLQTMPVLEVLQTKTRTTVRPG